jgi:hypothetical protein
MSTHGKYIFTIGDRTYKGDRLPIIEGFEFGAKVVKELSKILASSKKDINLESIKTDEAGTAALGFLLQCLSEVDVDVYMGFFKTVLRKTIIEATAPGEQGIKYICRDAELNDWFSKYPSDLPTFSFKIILENVTPFLPEEGLQVMKTFTEGITKQ